MVTTAKTANERWLAPKPLTINFPLIDNHCHDMRFLTSLLVIWLCYSFGHNITCAAQQPADMVIIGQHVMTLDDDSPAASAVAIRGQRIVAVTDRDQIEAWIGPQTQRIQLTAEQTLLPGLIESHGHFLGLGQSLMMLDLRTQETWEEIVADVAAAAEKLPAGSWIIGRGWHQSKWKSPPVPEFDGYPVHETLSRAVPDHPVLLTHASGHACFANLAAMRIAGVNDATEDPPGGEIGRDSDGKATGLFRERAAGLIQAAQSRTERMLTNDQRQATFERAIELAVEECHRHGITSFHDAGSSFEVAANLRQLSEQGKLAVRMYVMIRDSNDRLRGKLATARVVDAADGFFTVRAIKKSIDGALGPHGAWLLSPYEDLISSVGLATLPMEDVHEAIQLAIQHDYQVCIHAIGDRANREVLDRYQQALPLERLRDSRWRIEHAQHLDPVDVPRFGQLGVIAAIQGIHCTSDAPFVAQRLGYRRAASGAYVWRDLIDSGALLCNGTDAPVEPLNPFPSLYASVSRRLANGTDFFPEQSMTLDEALRSYTINGAYAAFEEDQKGSLTVGKLADMIIIDRDLRDIPVADIPQTQVVTTIIGGKIVYQK